MNAKDAVASPSEAHTTDPGAHDKVFLGICSYIVKDALHAESEAHTIDQ